MTGRGRKGRRNACRARLRPRPRSSRLPDGWQASQHADSWRAIRRLEASRRAIIGRSSSPRRQSSCSKPQQVACLATGKCNRARHAPLYRSEGRTGRGHRAVSHPSVLTGGLKAVTARETPRARPRMTAAWGCGLDFSGTVLRRSTPFQRTCGLEPSPRQTHCQSRNRRKRIPNCPRPQLGRRSSCPGIGPCAQGT